MTDIQTKTPPKRYFERIYEINSMKKKIYTFSELSDGAHSLAVFEKVA